MPIPAYMWIIDEQSNPVNSTVKIAGRENSAEILGFEHKLYIPSDKDTGSLTGTRKHEPLVVVKNFCAATPILNKACCSGKTLQEVRISWYRINDMGSEEEYFRHLLADVKVVAVRPIVENVKDPAKECYGHVEEVHFRYQKIQWLYLDGNIATQDQWTERM